MRRRSTRPARASTPIRSRTAAVCSPTRPPPSKQRKRRWPFRSPPPAPKSPPKRKLPARCSPAKANASPIRLRPPFWRAGIRMRRLALFLVFACAAFAAEEGGAAKHEGGDQLLQKWVNFAILAGGIGFLAVKVGGPAFRAKKHEILDSLAEGTRRAEAAAEKAAEIDRRMAGLQDEVAALRAKANVEMAAEAERLRQET